LLLNKGVVVNSEDELKDTPLYFATQEVGFNPKNVKNINITKLPLGQVALKARPDD
jgi:hypothetical protein